MNRSKKITALMIMVAVTVVAGVFTACGSGSSSGGNSNENSAFSEFAGKDLNGKDVDQSVLKGKKVTLLNLWFNGCSACVSEMPQLEKLSKEMEKRGLQLIGVNVDDIGDQKTIDEANKILKNQGVTYKNILINRGDKALEYINGIMAFPTNILVDENGNIIGDPMCGAIDSEEAAKELLKKIDNIKE